MWSPLEEGRASKGEFDTCQALDGIIAILEVIEAFMIVDLLFLRLFARIGKSDGLSCALPN